MSPLQTLIVYGGGAIAIALVLGPRLIEWIGRRRKASPSSTLLAEYQAMQTLKARAERLGCENLKAAVEAVKECFMDGDKLE